VHKRKQARDEGRSDEVAGTAELKAVAQEAWRLGAHALDKGRAWLNQIGSDDHRSEDMTHRQGPGATALTRMPRSATAWASEKVKAWIAPLVAA